MNYLSHKTLCCALFGDVSQVLMQFCYQCHTIWSIPMARVFGLTVKGPCEILLDSCIVPRFHGKRGWCRKRWQVI